MISLKGVEYSFTDALIVLQFFLKSQYVGANSGLVQGSRSSTGKFAHQEIKARGKS